MGRSISSRRPGAVRWAFGARTPCCARQRRLEMSDQQRDVIAVLEQDHREVEQMFAELESLRRGTGEERMSRRKDLMKQVTIELVRHSVAEEVLVYPQVEKKVSADEAERARK